MKKEYDLEKMKWCRRQGFLTSTSSIPTCAIVSYITGDPLWSGPRECAAARSREGGFGALRSDIRHDGGKAPIHICTRDSSVCV
jgi:hypothetical protein